MPERKPIVEGLQKGFNYLENRLTGNCDEQFSCVETYMIFRLAQIFDPSFAATTLTPAMVDDLVAIKPLASFDLIAGLKKELPAYLVAAASCGGFNRADPEEYSRGLLKWWRINNPPFPTWAKGGRAHHLRHGAELGGERACLLPRQVDVWQGAAQLAGGLRARRVDVAVQQAQRRLSSPHFAAGDEATEAWWLPRASPAEIHSADIG